MKKLYTEPGVSTPVSAGFPPMKLNDAQTLNSESTPSEPSLIKAKPPHALRHLTLNKKRT